MKMIRCQKCGTVIMGRETALENMVDAMNEALSFSRRCPSPLRSAAIQEAAEYKSIIKAFAHNQTQKEYAESVTPYILRAMLDYVRDHDLMNAEEINAVYESGKARAKAAKERAEQAEAEMYGRFENALVNRIARDPTAKEALSNVAHKNGGGGHRQS